MISIIIPIYNTPENMLLECIESILKQNYQDFEVILVDDGSSEETKSTILKISMMSEKIRIISKNNGGVSSARNIGLRSAQGEYIIFVDGDDIVEPGCFDSAIKLIDDYDLIVGKINWFNKQGIIKTNLDKNSNSKQKKDYSMSENKKEIIRLFMNWPANNKEFVAGFQSEIWGKVFKKEIIDDLRFNENVSIGEDAVFLLEYLLKCQKIVIINNVIYNYRINDESAMWRYDIHKVDKYKNYIRAITEIYVNNNLDEYLSEKVYYQIKEMVSCFYNSNNHSRDNFRNAINALNSIYEDDNIKKKLCCNRDNLRIPGFSAFLLKHNVNAFKFELFKRRFFDLIKECNGN